MAHSTSHGRTRTRHSLDHPGNIYRHWSAIRRISGEDLDPHRQLPFAVKPKRKLTVQDVVAVMRDHFEGTARDSSADGTRGDPHKLNEPTVCADGTRYSFVAQLRSGLPEAISSIVWLAFHNPDVQALQLRGIRRSRISRRCSARGMQRGGLAWHLDTAFVLDRTPVPEGFNKICRTQRPYPARLHRQLSLARKAWREFESDQFEEPEGI